MPGSPPTTSIVVGVSSGTPSRKTRGSTKRSCPGVIVISSSSQTDQAAAPDARIPKCWRTLRYSTSSSPTLGHLLTRSSHPFLPDDRSQMIPQAASPASAPPGSPRIRPMTTREAACSCGQLRVEATGDPVRISLCHCLACQRRSGSAFAIQARFPSDRVHVAGRFREYVRLADEGGEKRTFHFCPDCGGTVFYTTSDAPDLVAVPVGAFADPSFPAPTVSVYESR